MAKMLVGTNLAYTSFEAQPFLNLLHTIDGFDAHSNTGGSFDYHVNSDGVFLTRDADGYPTSMAGIGAAASKTFSTISTVLMNGIQWDVTNPFARYRTGTYVFLYDGGDGTESFAFSRDASGASGSTGSGSPGSTNRRITMTVANTGIGIGFNINNTGTTNTPKNFRLCYKGSGIGADYDGETLLAAGETFNPDFLARTDPYQAVRFMDWMQANNNFQVNYSERPTPTQLFWNQIVPSAGGIGVPVEVMVALCNKLNVHGWFCMPYKSTDAYVTSFATTVLSGNGSAPTGLQSSLNSNLKAYVEYGNEVFNLRSANNPLFNDVAALGATAFPSAPNDTRQSRDYQGLRSTQMWAIWKTVFASAPSRVIRVLGSQLGDGLGAGTYGLGLQAGDDGGIAPAAWTGTVGSHADIMAVAPYIGPYSTGTGGTGDPTSVNDLFDRIINDVAWNITGSITSNILTITANPASINIAPGIPLGGAATGVIIDQLSGPYGNWSGSTFSVTPQPNVSSSLNNMTVFSNYNRSATSSAWTDMGLTQTYGLTLCQYEGGWQMQSTDSTVQGYFETAQHDHRLYVAYTQLLNCLNNQQLLRTQKTGISPIFMQFSDITAPTTGQGFNFGTLENVLQTHSPRYDALVDFIGSDATQILMPQICL